MCRFQTICLKVSCYLFQENFNVTCMNGFCLQNIVEIYRITIFTKLNHAQPMNSTSLLSSCLEVMLQVIPNVLTFSYFIEIAQYQY